MNKKINTPNKLTLFRIVLVIPIIVLLLVFSFLSTDGFSNYNGLKNIDFSNKKNAYYLISSGILFIVAMITDFIDGRLARKNNQITTFGKLFDPIADKVIITTIMVFMASFNYTYALLVVFFIIRDLVVDGSRNIAASNNLKVEASIWGKLKTILQSLGILVLFFSIPFIDQNIWWHLFLINIPMLFSLFASFVSGFLYFKNIWPIVKKSM